MIGDEELRASLATHWDLADAAVEAHHGGMNSATWFVTAGERRWVAKSVPRAAAPRLRAGLAVAARVQGAGIPAGAAVPTADGNVIADVDGHPLALLSWVPGAALTGTDAGDQRLMGATLARVHNALAGVTVEDMDSFHWIDINAEHLAVRPWIRGAVATAVDALDEVGPHGVLHTDPAPEAFRLDPERGVCGLIDWSVAVHGPLLYDIASAAMYVGGRARARPLLDAYLDHAQLLSAGEIERGLPAMVRFRWAVQADYFARRIVEGDLTGIRAGAENEKGLADARRGLSSGPALT